MRFCCNRAATGPLSRSPPCSALTRGIESVYIQIEESELLVRCDEATRKIFWRLT